MPRPSKPLVTRESAARVALALIDASGLEGFSLPRLAREMGVSTPALYHHFSDRADVLGEVARLVLSEAATPPEPEDPARWQEWVVQLSLNLRDAVLRHRKAAPVLFQFLPRDLVTLRYEQGAAFFSRAGIPQRLHIELMDGIEKLSLGAILAEAMQPRDKVQDIFPVPDAAAFPLLAAAKRENPFSAADLHREALLSFMRGVRQREDSTTGRRARE